MKTLQRSLTRKHVASHAFTLPQEAELKGSYNRIKVYDHNVHPTYCSELSLLCTTNVQSWWAGEVFWVIK